MILPSQIIVYGSVLITIALALLLIATIATYASLLRKYKALLEEKSKLKAEAESQVDKIFQEVRQKAHQIIEESRQKATKIVGDAGVISNELKEKMLNELNKVSAEYTKDYQGTLDAAKNESIKIISNMSKGITSEASHEIQAMRATLQQEVAKTHAETKKAIDEVYKRVEEEIKVYKERKLKKVDEQALEIVKQVSSDVLGKAIDAKQHEELVIKALEEAKRQGTF